MFSDVTIPGRSPLAKLFREEIAGNFARRDEGLRALGYEIENNARNFEIKHVPASLIQRFSKRHEQIEAEAQRYVANGFDGDVVLGRLVDDALKSKPVFIRRGEQVVQLNPAVMPEPIPVYPPGALEMTEERLACINSMPDEPEPLQR